MLSLTEIYRPGNASAYLERGMNVAFEVDQKPGNVSRLPGNTL